MLTVETSLYLCPASTEIDLSDAVISLASTPSIHNLVVIVAAKPVFTVGRVITTSFPAKASTDILEAPLAISKELSI